MPVLTAATKRLSLASVSSPSLPRRFSSSPSKKKDRSKEQLNHQLLASTAHSSTSSIQKLQIATEPSTTPPHGKMVSYSFLAGWLLGWYILHPGQHDNGYIDDRSHV